MRDLSRFTNRYQLSKTLRFELKPVGETLANIQRSGILERDTARAESYKRMKKTIDEYHKSFVDRALSGTKLSGLEDFAALYSANVEEKRTEEWKKAYDKTQADLRKQIVKRFAGQADFKDLNKKELIRDRLKAWIDAECPDLYYDEDFRTFTTYFTGYNENRMNMYSEEEKATAVSHRLINENLPKFLDNAAAYQKVKNSPVAERFLQLCADMEPWLNVNSLDDLFCVSYYNHVLTQSGIDAYNVLLGGRREDGDTKLKGLNEYINRYNQEHPDTKLPKMKMLYKQILSDRGSLSWLPEAFADAGELLDAVQDFSEKLKGTAEKLEKALKDLPDCDAENIYVRKDALGTISNRVFGVWNVLRSALGEEGEEEKTSRRDEENYASLAFLQARLDEYAAERSAADFPELEQYAPDCLLRAFSDGMPALKETLAAADAQIADLLNVARPEESRLTQEEKTALKTYLDAAMEILHFVKPLYLSPDAALPKDDVFYGAFAPLYENELAPMTKLYDMVRNFATQKLYDTEKVKLTFDCSTLLNGWDVNKERENLGVLLLRGGNYYLAIMDKKNNKVMQNLPEDAGKADGYRKVDYKLLPGPNKMLPKVFFSKTGLEQFAPDAEILRIYKSETFKKGPQFSLDDCRKLIDFYKTAIAAHPDWKHFGFCFSPTESYSDISGFYREVSEQGYKLACHPVPADYIDGLVREGKLYLFQIYNKDFSPHSKGKPNLHTLYWKALFDENNLRDVVYKLNGQAEIFYRKRSVPEKERTVHPAGQPIKKKNPELKGQVSTFEYDITKDRRYTVDKFQFHVPITMNFKSPGSLKLNDEVCEYLKDNPDVNIIGIDRGERHLLYISLIDRNGRVVRDENGEPIQRSLNTITGEYRDGSGAAVRFETPYHELLDKKEKEREEARENWSVIENIKELKAGYLSQVVHHIARLMVKYNAIVVMEDLNSGFKRGRIKVEKQVYQKFEKALIEKLNYLVFKDVPADQTGGLYRALQLTNKLDGYKNLAKQSGFLFYIPAWNTSKIDPVTGFTDLLRPGKIKPKDAPAFFRKFQSISYDAANDRFSFRFDYSDFTDKAEGSRTEWEVFADNALRYAYDRRLNSGKDGTVRWNVCEKLKKLFDDHGVEYRSGGDLREAIAAQTDAPFFRALLKNLQVTLALRYSCKEDDKDFILSPVADENGNFYCSETCADGLPKDADANGAYNIARKGLWVLEQIDRAEKYTDWTTKVKNKEWLAFVQRQEPRP